MTVKDKQQKTARLYQNVLSVSKTSNLEAAVANATGVTKMQTTLDGFMQRIQQDGGMGAIKYQLKQLSAANLLSMLGSFEGTNADTKLKRMSLLLFGDEDMKRVLHFEAQFAAIKETAESLLYLASGSADEMSSPGVPYNLAILKIMIENERIFKMGQEAATVADAML